MHTSLYKSRIPSPPFIMKSSPMGPTYPNLSRIQRWKKVETASDRDWPADKFFLKCCEGYISHTKPEHSDPSSQMVTGGENHNISKNQTNPTVQYRDMAVLVSALKIHSLIVSPFFFLSFGHPLFFLHNFAIYIANISIFIKTPLYQV